MLHFPYLIGVFLATALGWGSWFLTVSKMSPFISGTMALVFFYTSLFIALAGTFTILNYYLRLAVDKEKPYFDHLNIALRQGCLLSIMICVGLSFQRLRVLTWWDALLLLAIVVLIEYYFRAKD